MMLRSGLDRRGEEPQRYRPAKLYWWSSRVYGLPCAFCDLAGAFVSYCHVHPIYHTASAQTNAPGVRARVPLLSVHA